MKSLIVAVFTILFVANLVNSASVDGPPAGPIEGTAPVPGPVGAGDLKTDSTFWWPGFWGFGGEFGYGGGWGGGWGRPYGGGWGRPYGGGWGGNYGYGGW